VPDLLLSGEEVSADQDRERAADESSGDALA
jgi:hypothetical protein